MPTQGEPASGTVLTMTSMCPPPPSPNQTVLDKGTNNGFPLSKPLLLHLTIIYVFPAHTGYSRKPLAAS